MLTTFIENGDLITNIGQKTKSEIIYDLAKTHIIRGTDNAINAANSSYRDMVKSGIIKEKENKILKIMEKNIGNVININGVPYLVTNNDLVPYDPDWEGK